MDANDIYKNFKINNPYPYQIEVFNKFEQFLSEGKPLLIKAPTGSGKTESVLFPYLNQFISNKFKIAPRMIYVLPMRVLINNVYERIKNYIKKIPIPLSVEIQHGDIPNSPFFISDIVVTTLDQFFYGFVRASHEVGHHIDVPAGSIASSLVVFDEAHMYRDEFTFSIMRALMEILYHSKVPFVVMTATIPESLEKSLFENIHLDNDQKIYGSVKVNSSLNIKIENKPLIWNNEINFSNDLLQKIKTKKTLIVLNQVGRAQKVYEEIKRRLTLNHGEIVLLHSRFTRLDRETHEKEALSIIPHKENGEMTIPEGKAIVVSTQVLEAGIDFSAELLLTELAPADCLIQRAGRCARYDGEKGDMIIFPMEEKDNANLPYKKEHLENTLNWLKKHNGFNIRDFKSVCSFVDETLDYKVNDYEASDTLIDLYECVLYADNKPLNIQLREGKPITLFVIDVSIGQGNKKEEQIKDAICKTNIRENSINVDFKVGWKLLNDGILKYRLDFDIENSEWNLVETKDISPFSYYILEKNYYDQLKGVISDGSSFVI